MPRSRSHLPAEWEPQAAVLLAWPHLGTDWAERLDATEASFAALTTAITRFEPAIVCVPDAEVGAHAAACLAEAGANLARVRFVDVAYDDTWLRDSGPVTLKLANGPDRLALMDFRFTGWGGKFEAAQDDALVGALAARGLFAPAATHRRIDFALEGGAIESDGCGTLLTTWRCLHQRHPDQTRAQLTATLCETLAAERVLWLEHGYLQGDDTDAHVDTLARFAPDDAIVYQACGDPADAHHPELAEMRAELEALRTLEGRPYRLFALPWPRPIVDGGRRLAASYANYLIVNGAVLVPAYGDAADAEAARTIGLAHPGRTVVPVPCRPFIWQNGSLHCLTMQLPAGAVA
ncbi:MAG TPA: agmatine deiminase family protein [Rhodanobacteraceae bacterium]|nr:agmatine deiminase family protein [Rhodanobacteraceae bacterium]